MKIAYVCADPGIPVLGNKGASVHVREFTHALVALGHDVHVYAACAVSMTAGEQVVNAMSAPLHVFPPSETARETAMRVAESLVSLNKTRSYKNVVSEILHILADQEFIGALTPEFYDFAPDLIIARHAIFSVAGTTLARTLGCPCVLEVNAPLVEERRRYWDLMLERDAESVERRAFHEADLLVAVSEGVRRYLASHGAEGTRVRVQPNGVDLQRFHPGIDGQTVRARYGLENKLVIGFSGSLKPWHGVEALLHAFANVRARLLHSHTVDEHDDVVLASDLHLLLVGDGPQYERIVELSQELKISEFVTLTGMVAHEEIPAHLAAFDIAAAPYLASESFYFSPLKVMEYLAMGCATLAPALGQIPALLQSTDGPCGLCYLPDAPLALENALLQLIQQADLRLALGQRAVQQAQRRASWQVIAQDILMEIAHMRSHTRTEVMI